MYAFDGIQWNNKSEFQGMSRRYHQITNITPLRRCYKCSHPLGENMAIGMIL